MLRRNIILGGTITVLAGVELGLGIEMFGGTEPPVPSSPAVRAMLAEQENSLQPSRDDEFVTTRFAQLEKVDPFLKQIRKGIGSAQFYWLGFPYSQGSVILLDKEGTLALCAHQVDASKAYVSFFPEPFAHCQTTARISKSNVDKRLDLAFATMEDISVIEKFGLVPVTWGRSIYDDGFGDSIILTGVTAKDPASPSRLHATQGHMLTYDKKIKAESGEMIICKARSSNPLFEDMSGGGAFCKRKFIGMNNAAYTDEGIADGANFTPVEAIGDAYVRLFPDRAVRAGVTADNFVNLLPARPECIWEQRTVALVR
jgi:hypothetical protein